MPNADPPLSGFATLAKLSRQPRIAASGVLGNNCRKDTATVKGEAVVCDLIGPNMSQLRRHAASKCGQIVDERYEDGLVLLEGECQINPAAMSCVREDRRDCTRPRIQQIGSAGTFKGEAYRLALQICGIEPTKLSSRTVES